MGIGERIKETRKAKKISQVKLAKAADISQSCLSTIESGVSNPKEMTVKAIAAALDVPVSKLMGEMLYLDSEAGILWPDNAYPISTVRIPILGEIHCGEPSFADQEFESYVEVGSKLHVDFALRAKGDSMIGARIHDGDLVFIRRQDTVRNGEIAAVLIDDSAALKRVRYLPGNMIMLQAENSAYEPILVGGPGENRDIRILGKAIAFQADIH